MSPLRRRPLATRTRTRPAAPGTLVLTLAVLSACAPAPEPVAAPAPAPVAEPAPVERVHVRKLPVDTAFADAVAAGTRTRTGAPGPAYWTQEVDYHIEAQLDPASARLDGEEIIRYRNNSPDTLTVLVLRLYQNLFSEGVPRNRNVPITGGMTLERVAAGGVEVRPATPGTPPTAATYRVDGTLMLLHPPRPVPPGGSTELELAWHFTVPPAGAPRHGHIDHRIYNVAQWYPQVATYDDLEGWHRWPYMGDGEFYLEYGDFDVSLTVPEGWLVGASGELRNPEDVLTPTVMERLGRALRQAEPVHVVTEDMFGPGNATRQAPGGQLTWRFRAEQVRDFAFATSDRYLWDASRALSPDRAGGAPDTVAVHTFFPPSARSWTESARFVAHSLEYHAERWHPYVWPQMTGAAGPVGGMEYPMLTFVAPFPEARTVYEVLNHEIAHMWYPMMVGSNEPSYAWMDEGLATYVENYATADFYGDDDAWAGSARSALAGLRASGHTPVMRHADLHGPGGTRGASSYHKPAMLLRALEHVIGRDAVWQGLAEYAEDWLFRHPQPLDFFNTMERVGARDLDWFWYPWFYETVAMDHALESVRPSAEGRTVALTVADQGDAPMPILVRFTLEGGETVDRSVPVDAWLEPATRQWTGSFDLPASVTGLELNPDGVFLEPDRDDNTWSR